MGTVWQVDRQQTSLGREVLQYAAHAPTIVEAVGEDNPGRLGFEILLIEAPEALQSQRLRLRPEAPLAMLTQPFLCPRSVREHLCCRAEADLLNLERTCLVVPHLAIVAVAAPRPIPASCRSAVARRQMCCEVEARLRGLLLHVNAAEQRPARTAALGDAKRLREKEGADRVQRGRPALRSSRHEVSASPVHCRPIVGWIVRHVQVGKGLLCKKFQIVCELLFVLRGRERAAHGKALRNLLQACVRDEGLELREGGLHGGRAPGHRSLRRLRDPRVVRVLVHFLPIELHGR
mmetsp:Transcript_165450/g.525876  ORF Transcript_165450/g.525876 Transcript_165450/m.525876 type:complete len:291 (+) Transcript_165450:255-1127(+)